MGAFFMNHIFIAGHLGSDPEVRFTSSGQKVTTLRVACNARRSGKDETVWWKVTAWGEQFDKMMPFFKKGSPIMVMGELLKPELFNDKEGKPQISLNITASQLMFSPFGRSDGKQEEKKHEAGFGNHFNPMSMIQSSKEQDVQEEEIPF